MDNVIISMLPCIISCTSIHIYICGTYGIYVKVALIDVPNVAF